MANDVGRPEIPIDWNKLDELLEQGCNGVQCAAVFGMHADTLCRRCFNEKGIIFTDYAAKKREKGNSSLHAAQYKVAVKGNVPMLIWLGKQRLDQKDTPAHVTYTVEEKEYADEIKKQLKENREELARIAKMTQKQLSSTE